MLDTAIIGSGPAALSAGIYLGRAGINAKIYERGLIGGELSEIDQITNYPGFEGSGLGLAKIMQAQAEAVGVKVELNECYDVELVEKITNSHEGGNKARFRLKTDAGEVMTRTVLVATGSTPRPLGFELKKPMSYCALCDGILAKGKRVAVVGGGNAAAQSALYLAPIVEHVTLVTHSKFKADRFLQTKVHNLQNFSLVEDLEPTPEYLNNFDYIFIYIGKTPTVNCLKNLKSVVVDGAGYIVTGKNTYSQSSADGTKNNHQLTEENTPQIYDHQTSIKGLFAAGDVRSGMVQQVVTAAGDGATAALEIIEFLQDDK